MSTPTRPPKRRTVRIVICGALAVLVALMVANTRFLTADEAQAITPAAFNAADFAKEAFPEIVDDVAKNATDLTEVVTAVTADPTAAGQEYGHLAGTDKYAIPVKLTGLVSAADANFLTIVFDGLPAGVSVRIPVAQAINGTALRDVTGQIKFADFTDQTDYQQVANELKTVATTEVIGSVDVASLLNKQIAVDGVYVTNSGPVGTFVVTPVTIEIETGA